MKTLFIGMILGVASCLFISYLVHDTRTEVISERWVHDTTNVKLTDTITVKGDIVYVRKVIHDTTRMVLADSAVSAVNHQDTMVPKIESSSAVVILHRGMDSVVVHCVYHYPPKNDFEFRSKWNQDSYKEVTIEKKNKFGLGFYGGVGMTPKGFQPVIGVGAFYRIEFNLKDLF